MEDLMKKLRYITWLVFLGIALPVLQMNAQIGSSSSQDPLQRIDYMDAFNQSKIHERFKDLMLASCCAGNVFSKSSTALLSERNKPLNPTVQQAYERACLKRLQSAREWTIAEPARESLTLLALSIGAAIATNKMLDKKSMGGSFSIFATVSSSVYLLREVINSGYNLAFQSRSALTRFEESFAQNQCFIPHALWPAIIEKFMLARQNPFEQRKCMDFIEFTLGLTAYKPKPAFAQKTGNAPTIIKELHVRIDQFFNDYNDTSDGECCRILKVNISKFILDLFNNTQTSRYMYLCGPGGIGKTYFVQLLCSWIEELLPGSVQFEDLVITSAEELEGSQQRPGAMLRVFRNQLTANKRASVIFMDEATWLNHGHMTDCAKRVFNGNKSKLSTSYFGDGIEGTGINLNMSPILVFVASNDEIKDPALKSRFDTIKYPLPKPEALKAHALNTIKRSSILDHSITPSEDNVSTWLKNSSINDFRHVEANVEQFILSQQ